GLFARVRIPVGSKYRALLLPPEAVGSDLSQQFVFVVDDQNLVQYRKVTLGPIIDGWRVVRDGVQPEDWVIVKGVQRAKTGAKVDPIKQATPDADRKSTRLNSSHEWISYAVFCLKKKKT